VQQRQQQQFRRIPVSLGLSVPGCVGVFFAVGVPVGIYGRNGYRHQL
jgi:hypothetical protein